MAYFDYNATAPLNSTGSQAMIEGLQSQWMNPSSPYGASARVHNVLEAAREKLAVRLKKTPEDIVFTGGATEANNAIVSYLSTQLPEGKKLVVSPFEHPSVEEAALELIPDRMIKIRALPDGLVDMAHLKDLFRSDEVGAVSLMAVNNESGVVQPWQEVAHLCLDSGVPFHCDASQWFGKCEGGEFGNCDFLVGCAHKFGGPKGVGFVALSTNSHGFRAQLGGGQEFGRRGGTENTPAILSMVAALEGAESDIHGMQAQAKFRDEFESHLKRLVPETKCIGETVTRVPNTSFLVMPRFENLRWVRKLDVLGFQVSTGSACSTGSTHASALLEALAYSEEEGKRTIRVSSGPETTHEDWLALGKAFEKVWGDLQRSDSQSNSQVISV